MKAFTRTVATGILAGCLSLSPLFADDMAKKSPKPLIEIAVLLDTSGSMDGLINQARARLWSIINNLASTKKDGQVPDLRVALYEYGKQTVPAADGYVRLIVPLTDDLDKISAELFALTTNGGEEYCGTAIQKAVEQLSWTPGENYQAIFIAGNEPFTQGSVNYEVACKAAIGKGIIVNTIHCGPEQDGINGMWKRGAQLADGQSINIDQNAQTVAIVTPHDARIEELGRKLNETYLAFGGQGRERKELQKAQDANAGASAPAAECERAVAKAGKAYKNGEWDLVDACKDKSVDLLTLKAEELPEEMQKMTPEERAAYVEKKQVERQAIQEEIGKLNSERVKFIAEEQKKNASHGADTFDTAVKDIMVKQLEKKGFQSEK